MSRPPIDLIEADTEAGRVARAYLAFEIYREFAHLQARVEFLYEAPEGNYDVVLERQVTQAFRALDEKLLETIQSFAIYSAGGLSGTLPGKEGGDRDE